MTPETPREGREQRNEYRLGVCPHGIYRDTRCFNCDPETPREAGRQETALKEALQQDANVIHYGRHTKKPKTHSALFEDCTNPRCVERRELLAAADRAERGLPLALDTSVMTKALEALWPLMDRGGFYDPEEGGRAVAAEYARLAADPQSPTGEGL